MMSESFEPLKIARYTVFRVYYEYQGQEAGEKLFVALKHDRHALGTFCWCIKATSQIQRFDLTGTGKEGFIQYEAHELPFFPKATVIDPSNFITMKHETLAAEAQKGRYRIEGRMPEDFHGRLVSAIRSSRTLEPKRKAVLLMAIGEKL